MKTSVNHEKVHSLEHEHILSGIVKCPICGSSMYGNVNRKKRKDGTLYKEYFYYACKHRRMVDGHSCTYFTMEFKQRNYVGTMKVPLRNSVATKRKLVEILRFRHFSRHVVFDTEGDKYRTLGGLAQPLP